MALGKKFGNILGDYFGDEKVELNPTKEANQNLQNYGNNSENPKKSEKVPIKEIKLGEYQTRTNFDSDRLNSLAKSIQNSGLLQPIFLLKVEVSDEYGRSYILLAGERRLRACLNLGYTEIDAVIKYESELDIAHRALVTAYENLEREDLSPIEKDSTFKMLMETQGLDEEGLAEFLSKSVQYIKNYLRLLNLSITVQRALLEKKLTEGQARHLVGLTEEDQDRYLQIILEKDLTVKEIIELIKSGEDKKKITVKIQKSQHNISPEMVTRASKLANDFPNSKVKFVGDDHQGKIVISWKEKKKKA